jgi:bzd-type benzoyl-CoA reductase N subunit
MTALDELTQLAGGVSNRYLEEWKAKGNRVLGFLCSHVPEEIVFAAGILPYRLKAPSCSETTSADVYMGHVNCTLVRSCLEFIYNGTFEFLDGFVFTSSCDHTRRLYDVIRETADYPFTHLISVSHKGKGDAIARWYRDEFNQLRQALEKTFAVQVSDDDLREAIEIYNESRTLLSQLYETRKREHPPLTGAEALNVVLAACAMPRDQHNRLLKKLLQELDQRQGVSGHRARLMIAGSGGSDDPDYYDVIEDAGGLIVADTLCFGGRYFWEPTQIGDDLTLNLAQAYLSRPSCANTTDQVADRFDFIKQMAGEYDVDGVIFQRIRYCDLWGGQLLYITDQMKKSKIPLLSLEREYKLGAVGQLRTRVQAFLESIE